MMSTSSLIIALTLALAIYDAGAFSKKDLEIIRHSKFGLSSDDAMKKANTDGYSRILDKSHSHKHKQPAGGGAVTTSSSESYFDRIKDAIAKFVLGWVLIIFSIPILWFNERRLARMESLIISGKKNCDTVAADKVDKDKFGCIVHLQNEAMVAAAPVKDSQFDVSFEADCVRLMTNVEIFQVIQHEHTQEKEKFGGGKEKVTTYTYDEQWSGVWHDSGKYQNKDMKAKNWKPDGLSAGTATSDCTRVELGAEFLLSKGLVCQCSAFQSAEKILKESVSLLRGQEHFQKGTDGQYYHRRNSKAWSGDGGPRVGDCRVKFSYVPNGPVTVLALQAQAKGEETRASFLPYRVIDRPWCGGLEKEDEKRAYLAEGQKGPEELAEGEGCPSFCPTLCCCACNLVAKCCSAILTPEINHLWQGDRSVGSCFAGVESGAVATTWGIRFAGWLMMFMGLCMTFAPFTEILVIIPFLGPILKSFAGFVVAIFSFIVTVLIALTIIMIAWLAYHPLYAVFYSLVIGAIVAAPIVYSTLVKPASA